MNLNDIVETPLYQAYANCPPEFQVRLLKNLMILAAVPEKVKVHWDAPTIKTAFYWSSAPQGVEFWADMSVEGERDI